MDCICRQVDSEILSVLRQRFEDCMLYEAPDHIKKCTPLLEQYEEATTNWFIKCKFSFNSLLFLTFHTLNDKHITNEGLTFLKQATNQLHCCYSFVLTVTYSFVSLKYFHCCYLDGDLGGFYNVKDAYMKQKHRMVWERRHGPVGSGMKSQDGESPESD